MKVYVVWEENYEDSGIICICDTEDLADEERQKCVDEEIEKYRSYLKEDRHSPFLKSQIEEAPYKYKVEIWEVKTRK